MHNNILGRINFSDYGCISLPNLAQYCAMQCVEMVWRCGVEVWCGGVVLRWCGGGVEVVWRWCGGGVEVVWRCGVDVWCGGVGVWCGGGVEVWGCGVEVVWMWCGGGVEVVWRWCGGGVEVVCRNCNNIISCRIAKVEPLFFRGRGSFASDADFTII